jgi:hypothetical protein
VQISGQAAAIRKVDGQSTEGAEIVDCTVNEKANKWILQPGNGPYYAVVVGKRRPGIPIVLSTWVFCDPLF